MDRVYHISQEDMINISHCLSSLQSLLNRRIETQPRIKSVLDRLNEIIEFYLDDEED